MDLPLFPYPSPISQPEFNAARNLDVRSVAHTERAPVDAGRQCLKTGKGTLSSGECRNIHIFLGSVLLSNPPANHHSDSGDYGNCRSLNTKKWKIPSSFSGNAVLRARSHPHCFVFLTFNSPLQARHGHNHASVQQSKFIGAASVWLDDSKSNLMEQESTGKTPECRNLRRETCYSVYKLLDSLPKHARVCS